MNIARESSLYINRLLFLSLVCFTNNIFAQEKKESEKPQITESKTNDQEIIGFRKGVRVFQSVAGLSITNPTGSFIDHEKVYDERLRDKILTGIVKRDIFGLPPRYIKPNYENYGMLNFGLDFGVTNNISAGMSLAHSSIYAKRADIQKEVLFTGQQILSQTTERRVYSENIFLFDLGYHFIPMNFFDPYVKLRAGLVDFRGEAHQYIDLNSEAGNKDSVTNGRGFVYGGSLGIVP